MACENDYKFHSTYPTAAGSCPRCGGKDYVPDPRYASLLALVREPCTRNDDSHESYQNRRPKDSPFKTCNHCGLIGHGKGFVLRTAYWEAAADGGLWGSILYAIDAARLPESLFQKVLGRIADRDAVQAVLEFVRRAAMTTAANGSTAPAKQEEQLPASLKKHPYRKIPSFCFGCGFAHLKDYSDCVWNKQP